MKTQRTLTPEALELIAARFKVLGESARLTLLHALMEGECTVSDLVDRTDFAQANVSKHLQILHQHGFVHRRKEGLYVIYELADPAVFQLCDIMCGSIEADAIRRHDAVAPEAGE